MAADLLSVLNPAQRDAVSAGTGAVLVLAGPGSGKTRVLTHRIAYLIGEMGIPPRGIIAVTFTNKAAAEMRARAESLLEGHIDGLQIGTFHSICARLLRIEADHLPSGYGRDYVIYDSDDQTALMKTVVAELRLDPKKFSPGRILNGISGAKNELITPEEYASGDYFTEIVKRAYPLYQQRLRQNNAMDFDDLLMQTVMLLRDNEVVRQKYQRRSEHVLIDEFQDTNTAQYKLIRLLGGYHGNLFAVGDEDQSIYAFRGADYRNVQQFRKDYPEARVILLEQNYRSTQIVLDAARSIIDKNKNRTPKQLFTDKEGGSPVTVHEAYSEGEEGEWVVERIRAMMRRGYGYRDFAVMYRINALSRTLEDAFKATGVPYRIVGGVSFYQRREIRDLVAYLRVINNPIDTISLNRIINTPTRGIGDKTVTTLHDWVAARGRGYLEALEAIAKGTLIPVTGRGGKALAEFASLIIDLRKIAFPGDDTPTDLTVLFDELTARIRYVAYLPEISTTPEQVQERLENIQALRGLVSSKKDLRLDDFLADVSLNTDAEPVEESGEKLANSVTLLTLHAAKGLEYPVVFIAGVEDGLLPHSRSFADADEMAEERRLMYVGLTRARDHLFLSYAFRRSLYGESIPSIPSRFLADIPQHLTEGSSLKVRHMTEREAYKEATRWDSDSPPPSPKPRAKIFEFDSRAAAAKDRPSSAAPAPIPTPTPGLNYKAGMHVYHPKFGPGIVIDSRRSGTDEEVSVRFEDKQVGLKHLLAAFAKMRIIP